MWWVHGPQRMNPDRGVTRVLSLSPSLRAALATNRSCNSLNHVCAMIWQRTSTHTDTHTFKMADREAVQAPVSAVHIYLLQLYLSFYRLLPRLVFIFHLLYVFSFVYSLDLLCVL